MEEPTKAEIPCDRLAVVRWTMLAVIACGFLAVDVVTPIAVYEGPILSISLVGLCIGQINLIAVWAALAPGNIVWRLPWSVLMGLFTWYATIVGYRNASDSYYFFQLSDAVELGGVILGGVVVAQIPLWIAGKVFRWKLVVGRHDPAGERPDRLQFKLWHMLFGTFLVALALAPARYVLPAGDIWPLRLDDSLWVLLSVVAVCNLVFTVPCVWLAFAEKAISGAVAACWLIYCAALTTVEYGVLVMALGSPGDPEVPVAMYLLNLAQCVAVIVPLLILRATGLQLRRLPR